MKDSLKTKIGIFLLFLSIISAFLLSLGIHAGSEYIQPDNLAEAEELQLLNESPKVEAKIREQIIGDTISEPTPFIKQQGKVKGENSVVKFEKDLETSLKIQEAPKIWLEYADENSKVVAVDIPLKVQSFIEKRWINTFKYSYQNQMADKRETKVDIYKNYLNDSAVFATTIDDFEITTPQEKRKISREEAFAIIHLTAEFAVERYKELERTASQLESRKSVK
jgi:hypothetical protein